jgi:hypothetical protein
MNEEEGQLKTGAMELQMSALLDKLCEIRSHPLLE